jgi:signal transduction histidine kinase/CheY-like chemotaxis protein
MTTSILTVELRLERDVVLARQRARQIAGLLSFDNQDQTRISTAVSEMARNAFKYAGGGQAEFCVTVNEPYSLCIKVSDKGPGISNLDAVLEGRYESKTGMGLGLLGARRLMDVFQITSIPGDGTRVLLGKHFPKHAPTPTPEQLARVADVLTRQRPADPIDEIQQQNQELIRTLEDLRHEREQLEQVNRELEETNRGVVALYAELDERADYLQRANEIKTKFLSNMTHEFRTPLNSITSLTRILLQKLDGELTVEQEKQVKFIERSAQSLSELVNDLLDLAKVEAGKILVRPTEFRIEDLFGTLRGMLRPLLAQHGHVDLVFEPAQALPSVNTDESKVSQILRNFISNALKYTEKGEVRVSAHVGSGNTMVFKVTDTGIGIAEDDQESIFEEYSQVDNPLQTRVKGTGLGLPLARKLAGLLGGSVGVQSRFGEGSTFFAIIPTEFRGPTEVSFVPEVSRILDPTRLPVLVVEDNRESLFVYEKYLKGTPYQVLPARTLKEARDWLKAARPVAVVLDVLLESQSTWGFLTELREQECYREIPILVITMVENEKRALALGADAYHIKPIEREWLLGTLERLVEQHPLEKLLVIDDDEVSRYLLRGLLADTRFTLIEASNGREGLYLAREESPKAIFLDLVMQGTDGFALLELLKSDPRTRDIPVFIHTSKRLSDSDRVRLELASAIVPKDGQSREAQVAAVRNALISVGLSTQARKEGT